MKKIFLIIASFMCMVSALPVAFATITIDNSLHPIFAPAVTISGTDQAASYGNFFLQLIAGGLLYLAAPVAILFIAIGGLRYVTSHGEENSIESAKKTVTWAVVGLVAVLLSWAIVHTVIDISLQANKAQPVGSSSTPGSSTPPSTPPSTGP